MERVFKPLQPVSFLLFFSLVLGVFFASLFPERIVIGTLPFALIAVSFLFLKRFRYYILAILFFCSGFILYQIQFFPSLPTHHISHFLNSEKYEIQGKIISFTKNYDHRQRTIVQCRELVGKDGNRIKVTGKVLLNIYGKKAVSPKIYDTIVFRSKLKPIRNFNNPGGFDYQKYMKYQHIFANAYTTAGKLKIIDPAGASKTQVKSILIKGVQSLEAFRNQFAFFVLNLKNGSPSARIIVSLVTGKKEIIDPFTRDIFSKAGISHLLAISGLHLSIVGFLFYWSLYQTLFFVCWILKNKGVVCVQKILVSGRLKKIVGALTILPLILYAGFTGFSPSSQRALIMTMVFLFSVIIEKETDLFSSLFTAGIIILVLDSTALFSISFQLSFTAVFFICSGMLIIQKYRLEFNHKWISKIFMISCVTIFAGFGTFALTAFYFHVVSFVQVFTNLVAIPIIGFLVLPMGFISLALFVLFPNFAELLIHICEFLTRMVYSLSNKIVSLPVTWMTIGRFHWLDVFTVYFFLIGVGFWLIKGHKKISVSFLIMGCISLGSAQVIELKNSKPIEQLRVTTIDVGQGASSLIQGPNDINFLVDGGGFSNRSTFDTGRYIVAPYLWRENIKVLDYVVLTHPEADHLNGLVYILENFKVKTLIKNKDKKRSRLYDRLINICNQKNISIVHPESFDYKLKFKNVMLHFYDTGSDSKNLNNNSLVFKLDYNSFSMLFTGDILKVREKDLSLAFAKKLSSDVLLSPHHGSASSSSKLFLDKVEPESVIIPCGWQNRYGFPHKSVLNRYAALGMDVYRTDLNGAVLTISDGKSFEITTFKDD